MVAKQDNEMEQERKDDKDVNTADHHVSENKQKQKEQRK